MTDRVLDIRQRLARASRNTTLNHYEHGGGRIFTENPRELVADVYDEGNRAFIFNAPDDVEYLLEQLTARTTWQPIETAPRDGTYILLAACSGYSTTPFRVEVCHYDDEYRPLQPWVNHSNDSFLDGGTTPMFWMPLPATPSLRYYLEVTKRV